MRRSKVACLVLVLLLAIAPALHGQLGGLKKKVTDKVTGKKPDTTATAAGKPKCDKSSMVITSDVVDRYVKALAARDAEIKKMAREPGQVGEYYAAYFKRAEVTRRKEEYDLRRGPDWEREKVIYPKMVKGDQVALQQHTALMDSLNPNKFQMPQLEWEAQQKGNARLDSVMILASGISACDWGGTGIGDRMPMLVSTLYNDPNTKDLHGYGTPAEGAAVKARIKELAAGLGYVSTPQLTDAEKAHIKAEDDKLARLAVLTGDPYTDCATGVQQEFMKKHQADMEKASKDKDMAASQRLSMLLAQETAKECKKYSKDQDDE
jgi:hypothetical protein